MGCCNAQMGLIAGAALGALVAVLGGILIPVGEKIIKQTVEKVRSSGEVLEPAERSGWVGVGVGES